MGERLKINETPPLEVFKERLLVRDVIEIITQLKDLTRFLSSLLTRRV